MRNKIISFLKLFGINRAVFFGVLSKVWLALAGIVTIFVIAAYFSREVQGYYFTFHSLLALQVFVELGLGVVIVHFSSHEWSKLELDSNNNGILGDKTALSRLKSLAKVAFRWYIIGAFLLSIGLGSAGVVFFSYSGQSTINWFWPWIALCFLTGVNLSLLPNFSILEGCGQIVHVYYYRFIHGIIRFFSAWAIMILGGNLWAAPGAILFPLVWTVLFIYRRYFVFFRTLFSPSEYSVVNWGKEIWPMQWRIAVSWLSGYFFFSLFTPVLFHYEGAVVAGQMGMTWSMAHALSMIASMWIVARIPQMGGLIAQKDYKQLDRIILRSGTIAVFVAMIGGGIIFFFVKLFYLFDHPFALRFLPPLPTALFLAATVLMQISYAESNYLRSHKKEPFAVLSVIAAALMAVSVVVGAKFWGALGIAVSYFSIVAFFIIPYGTVIWLRCKREWHPDLEVSSELELFPDEEERGTGGYIL